MKLLFIIDPIDSFDTQKDSTFMMMHAAAKRGWQLVCAEMDDLWVENGQAFVDSALLTLIDDKHNWYDLGEKSSTLLSDFDVVLMRKDPPFDMEYVYATYTLDLAEKQGVLIVNKPQNIRDANEKFAITQYPQFAPETLITRKYARIKDFLNRHKDIIVKPLDGMGGASIFRIKIGDANTNVILETITKHETVTVMVQKFEPAIKDGDKRILIIDGEPLPYLMARIPAENDGRGNLAAGAEAKIRKLTDQEYKMAKIIGQDLRQKGALFVGLDVIGDKLTEINNTSPTGIQHIYKESGVNAADILMEAICRRQRERV
ncbi:MAG: glutathione synthase [Francisellaceae bacterium]